jgi:hypothetical protein
LKADQDARAVVEVPAHVHVGHVGGVDLEPLLLEIVHRVEVAQPLPKRTRLRGIQSAVARGILDQAVRQAVGVLVEDHRCVIRGVITAEGWLPEGDLHETGIAVGQREEGREVAVICIGEPRISARSGVGAVERLRQHRIARRGVS